MRASSNSSVCAWSAGIPPTCHQFIIFNANFIIISTKFMFLNAARSNQMVSGGARERGERVNATARRRRSRRAGALRLAELAGARCGNAPRSSALALPREPCPPPSPLQKLSFKIQNSFVFDIKSDKFVPLHWWAIYDQFLLDFEGLEPFW